MMVAIADGSSRPIAAPRFFRFAVATRMLKQDVTTPDEQAFFSRLEQADPVASAVAYGLCYLAPRHSRLPPRFTPDFIHFDLLMLGKPKSAFSIRFAGEAWGGSVLSNSLAMTFASPMRQLIDQLGTLLGAKASFGAVGHHTYVLYPTGRPKASSLVGQLVMVDEIFRQMAAVATSAAG